MLEGDGVVALVVALGAGTGVLDDGDGVAALVVALGAGAAVVADGDGVAALVVAEPDGAGEGEVLDLATKVLDAGYELPDADSVIARK
ncbi:MAG: hypothetical protein JWN20_315 [Jatrophihabitantaceae bacterium]|nr:hypothetical protein [Jatrophihabitantaceae bacterium]